MERDECTERICSRSRTADILQGRPQAVNASTKTTTMHEYMYKCKTKTLKELQIMIMIIVNECDHVQLH